MFNAKSKGGNSDGSFLNFTSTTNNTKPKGRNEIKNDNLDSEITSTNRTGKDENHFMTFSNTHTNNNTSKINTSNTNTPNANTPIFDDNSHSQYNSNKLEIEKLSSNNKQNIFNFKSNLDDNTLQTLNFITLGNLTKKIQRNYRTFIYNKKNKLKISNQFQSQGKISNNVNSKAALNNSFNSITNKSKNSIGNNSKKMNNNINYYAHKDNNYNIVNKSQRTMTIESHNEEVNVPLFNKKDKTNELIFSKNTNENEKSRFGVQIWNDNAKYIGLFQENKANGFGIFYHCDGDIYKGEFKQDRADGYALYYYQNGAKYEGYWKEDVQNGIGLEIWKDESFYEGEYLNGKKNGIGKYSWPDGSFYEGEWSENNIYGYGIYKFSDGRLYKGEWKNNMMNGLGTFVWGGSAKVYCGKK